MRVAGFVLLGMFVGAVAGMILAMIGIVLWYDILGIGDHGGDGMNGLAAALFFVPVGSLIGALVGAIWLGRRASAGPVGTGVIAAGIVLMLVGLVGVGSLAI